MSLLTCILIVEHSAIMPTHTRLAVRTSLYSTQLAAYCSCMQDTRGIHLLLPRIISAAELGTKQIAHNSVITKILKYWRCVKAKFAQGFPRTVCGALTYTLNTVWAKLHSHSSLHALVSSVTPNGSTTSLGPPAAAKVSARARSSGVASGAAAVAATSYDTCPAGTATPHMSSRLTKLVKRPSFAFWLQAAQTVIRKKGNAAWHVQVAATPFAEVQQLQQSILSGCCFNVTPVRKAQQCNKSQVLNVGSTAQLHHPLHLAGRCSPPLAPQRP